MFTEENNPLCTAPFTSFLVDTNKGVRPCCSWEGPYLGNLNDMSISDVINGAEWVKIKRQLMMGIWPNGCLACKEREETTGWSVRHEFVKGGVFHSNNWRNITYIEFNSSNICNLACMHCSGSFSTSWLKQELALGRPSPNDDTVHPMHVVHAPRKEAVIDIIERIELNNLEQIMIKGGEPMLNSDIPLLLDELNKRDILRKIKVNIVTNGTQPNTSQTDKVFELLKKAKFVHFDVSVDGVGQLQEYIRYGKGSDIRTIESFMRRFSMIPHVRFSLLTSVMVYNVLALDEITDWWRSLPFKSSLYNLDKYKLFVINPAYLAPSCISDNLAEKMIAKYESDNLYSNVVKHLRDSLGTDKRETRSRLRAFTAKIDEYRATNLNAVAPILDSDLRSHP